MKQYEKNRAILLGSQECQRLFFNKNDIERNLDNTKMFTVLYSVMGNNQARAVAKYAIIQMILNEVPAHIITDFTGYKEDVYNYCQEWVDSEKGILRLSEKCKLLDSAFRKSALFDEM